MTILPYLVQLNLYWLLLYGCYWLLLRRQTFFVWNRAYLLGALVLPFGLPLLQYPAAAPDITMSPIPVAVYEMAALPLESATMAVAEPFVVRPQATAAAPFPWLDLLLALYAAGVVFMFVRLFWQFYRLFSFLRKGDRIALDGYSLVLLDDDRTGEASPGEASPGSFSFLNYIVINRHDYENDFDTVLRHELVHVRQRHSWDILLVEALRVVFWFNPVLVLYKKSLQQVHEYLADAAAPQRDRYADFLLSYALKKPSNALTNNFLNASNLKNRIKMLYKNRNSKWALGKYLAVAPLIGLVLILTAARERVVDVIENSTEVMTPASTLLIQAAGGALAETTTVNGTVRSSKTKDLLPGANVILAGTSRGVTTDANGAFELEEVPLDGKLAISYVGFETRVLEITKKNQVVNIVLEWQQNALGSVVVVSYPPVGGVSTRPRSGADSTKLGSGNDEFLVLEQMPEFPGGIQEMYKFLARKIKYPTEAVRDDLEGKVIVAFTVSDKGRIRNPQVIQRVGGGTDEEALRVVLSMPTWQPAIQNGRPVAMEYVLPIEFKLEKPEPKEDKEKRQGKANNFRTMRMSVPDFKFEDAVDLGIPGHGSNFSTIRGVRMPNSIYSKQKFTEDISTEQIIFIKDSIQPARFMNYQNPLRSIENLK
ncbi:M56 family metallopeptidase [Persicitalea jodogahamensis]|uniref:TonB C-terminal domain-containing protein n=1 Tax=Persicitalea jodogahamensis TaxID=402147 RepID=A0A8J3G9R1_9BACT|nr:M56 family metallopeptidase [Persicitalea jodogahamensis]GHB68691.1 hypothetical protein GCM10007390_22670 [Persicitalea jodogahamensis]